MTLLLKVCIKTVWWEIVYKIKDVNRGCDSPKISAKQNSHRLSGVKNIFSHNKKMTLEQYHYLYEWCNILLNIQNTITV